MAGSTKNDVATATAAALEADAAAVDAASLAEQAERALEVIEDGIREGDESITPEDLEKGRGLARFARLRREAAERKAAKAADEKNAALAKAAVANAVKLVRDLPGNAPELAALEDSAVAAVQAYFAAARSMHDEIRAAVGAVNDATQNAVELGLATPADHGIVVETDRVWVPGKDDQRVSVLLGDYTSRKAVRGLLERTGIAEFSIGGDARLTLEMREISWPNNAERF